MSSSSRVRDHIRSNAIAYVAVFFAISGSAAAINGTAHPNQVINRQLATGAVNSRVLAHHAVHVSDLNRNSVRGTNVENGSLRGQDLGDNSVTGQQIDESTLDPSVIQTRVSGDCPTGEAIRAVGSDGSATCEPTGKGTITGVTTSGGLTGGGTSGTVNVGVDPTQLQNRVAGNCSTNQAVQSVGQDGSVGCNPFVESVAAGTGLSGGTITNSGTLSVDPTAVQSRVSGSCAGSNAVQSVNQNGSVTCQPTGTGTVTSVGSGTGLSGGPITTSGSLSVDPTQVQSRLTSPQCSGNNAIQSVAQNGNVTCQATGTGTVTSVGSGTGLTGGPITTSGSLSVDPTTVQSRVSGACNTSSSNAIQSVNQNGTVSCGGLQNPLSSSCSGDKALQSFTQGGSPTCSPSFQESGHVLFSGGLDPVNAGATVTLYQANGMIVEGTCNASGTQAQVTIRSTNLNPNLEGASFSSSPGSPSPASSPQYLDVAGGGTQALTPLTSDTQGTFDVFDIGSTATQPYKTLDGSYQAFTAGGSCAFEGSAFAN